MPRVALQQDAAGRSVEVGGRKIVIENPGVVLDKSRQPGSLSVTAVTTSTAASSKPSAPPTSAASSKPSAPPTSTAAQSKSAPPTSAAPLTPTAGAAKTLAKSSANTVTQASSAAGKPPPSRPAARSSVPPSVSNEAVVSVKKEQNATAKPSVPSGPDSSGAASRPTRARSSSATVSTGPQMSSTPVRAPTAANNSSKPAAKLSNLPISTASKSSSTPCLSPAKGALLKSSKELTLADVQSAIMASDAAAGVDATLANAKMLLGLGRTDSIETFKISAAPKPIEIPKLSKPIPPVSFESSASLVAKFDAMVGLAHVSEDDKFKCDIFEKLDTMKMLMENIEKLKNLNVRLASQSAENGAKSWNDIAKTVERKIIQALHEKTRSVIA